MLCSFSSGSCTNQYEQWVFGLLRMKFVPNQNVIYVFPRTTVPYIADDLPLRGELEFAILQSKAVNQVP